MSKLDEIKPSESDGTYRCELLVEGEWVAMAIADKETIIRAADVLCDMSDEEV